MLSKNTTVAGAFPIRNTGVSGRVPDCVADPSTSAQGSDAPGRVHASVGTARSSVEQTDWHDEAERAFLKTLVDRLDKAITTGETTALILAAPPRALGMIRSAYSPAVQKAIREELAKDLVKMPVYEIEKQLMA